MGDLKLQVKVSKHTKKTKVILVIKCRTLKIDYDECD